VGCSTTDDTLCFNGASFFTETFSSIGFSDLAAFLDTFSSALGNLGYFDLVTAGDYFLSFLGESILGSGTFDYESLTFMTFPFFSTAGF
jgi:hypothetical protein